MDWQSASFWKHSLTEVAERCNFPVKIMEVCGTHTNAIAQNNLRSLLPETVKLISGPGCPICVSGVLFIEKIRELLKNNISVAMFGDLLRIPGSNGLLPRTDNLKTVYSPEDALDFALTHPEKEVVFAAVGFAPTLSAAAALMSACEEADLKNFSILSDFKELTPVLDKLCASRRLDGLLLPGHVASVTGKNYFSNISVPGVVAGFTPENILHSIKMLLDAIANDNKKFLYNNYPEAVRENGNPVAWNLINCYFENTASVWRGLGKVASGGWSLKEQYSCFDAEKRFDLSHVCAEENPACSCGEVLTGLIEPNQCKLFGKVCVPGNPVGACMSSSEGSCAAFYNYCGGRA